MALAGHYNCSRGFDRDDVPCHNHRKTRHAHHGSELHEVDHLGRDAAAVDDDDADVSSVAHDTTADEDVEGSA